MLPFGVASAPEVFLNMRYKVLQVLEGVLCYMDNILVGSEDERSHFQLLENVFNRMEQLFLPNAGKI